MLKLLRQIKYNTSDIKLLIDEIHTLRSQIAVLEKASNDRLTYDIIGMPFSHNFGKREYLLMQAKKRGFFDDRCQFSPIGTPWSKASFKYHYSNIAASYRYDSVTDTLYIPAIGVDGNISAGTVPVYSRGIWADLKLTQ